MDKRQTDKEKFVRLAQLFGDNYEEKPRSLLVKNWGRRFVFNASGYLEKVQDVTRWKSGKVKHTTISEAKSV